MCGVGCVIAYIQIRTIDDFIFAFMQLKWNPPSSDNGSKVTTYVLEYDEGKGGSHFVETYRGKNKQCVVSKLQPAFSYQFRLAAVNQSGQRWVYPVLQVYSFFYETFPRI